MSFSSVENKKKELNYTQSTAVPARGRKNLSLPSGVIGNSAMCQLMEEENKTSSLTPSAVKTEHSGSETMPPIQRYFTYQGERLTEEALDFIVSHLKISGDTLTAFSEERGNNELAQELRDWLRSYNVITNSTYGQLIGALKKEFGESFVVEDEESEEESLDADDILLQGIRTALDEGRFGIRWLTLKDDEEEEIFKRIGELVPVYRELIIGIEGGDESSQSDTEEEDKSSQSDTEEEVEPFIVHGSSLWGAKAETPGDIDVIYPPGEGSSRSISRDLFSALSRTPTNDKVMLSENYGPLDGLLGVDFNQTDFSDVDWGDIKEDLSTLIWAGINELEEKPQKGARKILNAAFVIQFFLKKLDSERLTEFDKSWKGVLAAANRSLVHGSTPDVSPEKAEDLLLTWIPELDSYSQESDESGEDETEEEHEEKHEKKAESKGEGEDTD